jgi:transcriptional regulator
MYVPAHFEEKDRSVLHALIRAAPLGAWVTHADGRLIANHIPFLLDPDRGALGTLVGHVARANPVWQLFSTHVPSVVIFQGAQSYISPSWYPGKQVHGKVVPTWNYAVVHAHGTPRVIEETDWLHAHVSRLSDVHEAEHASAETPAWRVTDAPPDYIAGALRGIVGIEIPIDHLEGKWKVSQNRSEADQRAVVTGLDARADQQSHHMARLVQERATHRNGD